MTTSSTSNIGHIFIADDEVSVRDSVGYALEQEGFGLGLSIARRMVDVMGGEIGVESVEGQGATFWVRLRTGQPATTPVA